MTFAGENSRTISEPPKNNSGLHTVRYNLKLTVYSYNLVISLSIFFYRDNCLGCLNGCYAFEYPDHVVSKCPYNWSNF